jgi:YD repeat-containing protein
VLSETHPESGTTTYEYYPAGPVKKITNSLGQVTTFQYDGENRLTFRDAPGTADDLTLTYDAAGRLATMSIQGVVTTYIYDTLAHLRTRTDTGDAAYHRVITEAFREAWPYGGIPPSSQTAQKIMLKIYSQYPLW